jgi:hypothetical protein
MAVSQTSTRRLCRICAFDADGLIVDYREYWNQTAESRRAPLVSEPASLAPG